MMRFSALTLTLLHGAVIVASQDSQSSLACKEIDINVSVSALNKDLGNLGLDALKDAVALNELVAAASSVLVGGNYTIAARYCEPTYKAPSRQHTLQFLAHGITYTRNYWSGLAAPGTKVGQDEYSWVEYAAKQGYPTLSIDRLCNGESSRPNGLAVCQLPLEMETIHAIVQSAWQGTIEGVERAFDKIIYVGHSYGSQNANLLAAQHPDDVDAYVLTGFTPEVTQGEAGLLTLPVPAPAAVISPDRFGGLLLDPTYLLASSEEGIRTVSWHGKYECM
jgi:pimeloyl-ACP methyl ester carboxylesterase